MFVVVLYLLQYFLLLSGNKLKHLLEFFNARLYVHAGVKGPLIMLGTIKRTVLLLQIVPCGELEWTVVSVIDFGIHRYKTIRCFLNAIFATELILLRLLLFGAGC